MTRWLDNGVAFVLERLGRYGLPTVKENDLLKTKNC